MLYAKLLSYLLFGTKTFFIPFPKREGFGLVVLEANSFKVPSVGRRVG
ncbi:hypothetical protein PF1217 [Pyrococcus furiosus DSM 3638]|uniref:Uncharacterized protein n=2 Tax=Pyrococcus furiosus TaxID=2261 RepID=Q8U1J0_PYRFU|nr:hypothetical protein PF1217 [Pyrococcus furiosus DSM 3638]AFN04005.1 hypothetical protein PFC_05300 [Pyrococcus furiosus COM1]